MSGEAWVALHDWLDSQDPNEPPAPEVVYQALDRAWGPGGWSCTFTVASAEPPAVVCTLEMDQVRRSGVGEGPDLQSAALAALWMAVQQTGRSRQKATPQENKPSAQELIDKLMAKLREVGKGREAAALVVKYGGYGSDPEETRRLYGELRALLLGKVPSE
ncbi:hypothetical protein [Oceanithermus sp.]